MSLIDNATEEEWNRAAATSRQVGGNHYKDFKIEPIEFIMANNIGYCEGNIINTYAVMRPRAGLQDLDKVIHYVELLKELKYGS